MSAKWADMDSDSDDEIDEIPIQPAGLNDGTVQVSYDSGEYHPSCHL
jgi:hypothetical protein